MPSVPRAAPWLLAIGVAVGCHDVPGPPQFRYGLIAADARDGGSEGIVVSPVGAFYRLHTIALPDYSRDTCHLRDFVTVGVAGPDEVISGRFPQPKFPALLDAGDLLLTAVSGRQDTLLIRPAGPIFEYRRSLPFAFTPGDTLTVTVPGADPGFPATELRVKTAESFRFTTQPLPVADGESIPLTWDAPDEPGAQMLVSLRFNSTPELPFPNAQIVCSFADTGAAEIPADLAWYYSQPWVNRRSFQVVRMRMADQVLDVRTRIQLISTYAQPLSVP